MKPESCNAVALATLSASQFPFPSSVLSLECPATYCQLLCSKIASSKAFTKGPFSISFPPELKKPLCFQSIPKSRATPKTYLLLV